jgi:hypothetical protein
MWKAIPRHDRRSRAPLPRQEGTGTPAELSSTPPAAGFVTARERRRISPQPGRESRPCLRAVSGACGKHSRNTTAPRCFGAWHDPGRSEATGDALLTPCHACGHRRRPGALLKRYWLKSRRPRSRHAAERATRRHTNRSPEEATCAFLARRPPRAPEPGSRRHARQSRVCVRSQA